MTIEALVCRTRLPDLMVREAILALESPDPHSRTKDFDGRRIIPIDPERGWGWRIVNYQKYSEIKSEFARKEYMRGYMKKRRAVKLKVNKVLTEVNHGKQKANLTDTVTVIDTSKSVLRDRGAGGRVVPVTVDDAVNQCCMIGVPKEFIMHCFDKIESRGGTDAQGISIENFPAYVKTQFKYEQERQHKEMLAQKQSGKTYGDNRSIIMKQTDAMQKQLDSEL